MLAVGQHCPLDLYPRVRTRFVTAEELRIVDRRLLSFLNVNTPAEWQTALALLEEQTVRASCSHLP
jgi:molybdopterin-guanine dinucleotide biosynthesis protein A